MQKQSQVAMMNADKIVCIMTNKDIKYMWIIKIILISFIKIIKMKIKNVFEI